MFALLVAFHRPVIFALLHWVGTQGASTQGLPLSWEVRGSLWNDLEIVHLQTGGGERHWLPRAALGKLKLQYDLLEELEHKVRTVIVHDLDVELDLRRLPAATRPDASSASPKKAAGAPPPLVWPRSIDVKNLSATLTLADGRRVAVRGLTFQVGVDQPGIFECRELRVEPDGPNFEALSAKIDWQPRLLVIRDFALPKDVMLDELRLDLQNFEAGRILAQIAAHLGSGKFSMQAEAADAFAGPLQVKARLAARELRSLELRTLGLSRTVEFSDGKLDLAVEGNPTKPSQVRLTMAVEAANLRAAGVLLDKAVMELEMKNAQAGVKTLQVMRGNNRVELTAQARLPQNIEEWQQAAWSAASVASISDASQLLAKPMPVKGLWKFDAKAEGLGATPTKVYGKLSGEALSFENYSLPELESSFHLDGKEARVELSKLPLGDGNSIMFKSMMKMQDAMPLKTEWNLQVHEPANLIDAMGLPKTPKTMKAKLDLEGAVECDAKDISAGRFSQMLARLVLKLEEGSFGDIPLPRIAVAAQARDGTLHLSSCGVRFDEENHLDLSADVGMQEPFRFETQGGIKFPALVRLNELLAGLGMPEIKSGTLFSQLKAHGELKPWRCEGSASLTAAKMHPAMLPEPADLMMEVGFEGTKADLKSLEARLGLWKLALTGVVDEKSAHLSQLSLWQKDTLLVDGHASAPLDVMKPSQAGSQPMEVVLKAAGLKLHEVLAAAGVQGIPPGTLNADISLNGRMETLEGVVKMNLKDVQVPDAPEALGLASIELVTTLREGRLKSSVKLLQPPLQPLMVDAEAPVDAAALVKNPKLMEELPLRVAVQMAESDLGFLRGYAPALIKELPAKLKLSVDVAGTVGKPSIQAAVDLDVAEVSWAKADLPSVRDVRARLRVKDRILNIEDVSLMMAGGRVKLGGMADANDIANPGLNLKLEAREALVFRDPTTSLRANADITCTGTLKQARVAGLVEAVRGRVFKEIDLMPVLKLPADVPPVPENTQRSNARLELPPMLKDWTFDLRVRTRDPLLVSGNLANGAISADVLLGGSGTAPQLTGGANIDRLLLKLPFSLVKITKGVVTLNPQKPFDPALDIRGESRIGSNDIALFIYGDSSNPKTRFTSTPPMSEPDIVTLLGTGTTLNGSASDLAAEAASRAAFLFISELYRKTFNQKKVVREEPPRLHMTFNPSGADRSNDSVQAAYDLSDHWRVSARFTQTGRMKALLGWVLRFGQAAQAVEQGSEGVQPLR